MSSYKSVPGWSDNCAHSPAGEPPPPKHNLQGDAATPYMRPLIDQPTKATSRGGNTKAPGGRLMAPTKPNGVSGRSVGSRVK